MLFVFLLFLFVVSLLFARKKFPVMVLAIAVLWVPVGASAQQVTEPDQSSPAAASPSSEPPEGTAAPASSANPNEERAVSWKLLFHNWVDDQKHIWTFPVRLAHGQDLVPTAAVAGVTAGLFFVDHSEAAYFRNTTTFDEFRKVVSGNAAAIGMGVTAVSIYGAGLIRKDAKMQHTALFIGEAMADTALVQTVLKDATMRLRPIQYPASGWFVTAKSPTAYIRGNGSFPSGHSMEAFAVATIIARRYGRDHRWVPYAAYGLASLVGFSRLTLNVHYLSDVVMGGAIGYSISRFTVLRQ